MIHHDFSAPGAPEPEAVIYLNRGLEVRISARDHAWASQFVWSLNSDNSPYAVRYIRANGKRRKLYLHRELVAAPRGMVVNHRDGDTFNCTQGNLQVVRHRTNVTTLRVNKLGAIPFVGVHFRNPALGEILGKKNVRAAIRVGEDRLRLGSFETIAEAVIAYDLAAVEHFGVYADTNFPLSSYLSPWKPPEKPPMDMGEIPF